jgi:hypothetical protein
MEPLFQRASFGAKVAPSLNGVDPGSEFMNSVAGSYLQSQLAQIYYMIYGFTIDQYFALLSKSPQTLLTVFSDLQSIVKTLNCIWNIDLFGATTRNIMTLVIMTLTVIR